MIDLKEQRLADIVFLNHRSAPIFEKHQLDFCCKGKRTLAQACEERSISLHDIEAELEQVMSSSDTPGSLGFTGMTPQQLSEYIVSKHHGYVRQMIPQILFHLDKLEYKHGEKYPYVSNVNQIFREVVADLEQHMEKEEKILFPLMAKLNQLSAAQLNRPIQVMEAEHEHAGDLLEKIRSLTNNYTAPEDACTTHRLLIEELKSFEEDLHQHVHLENHLLFPRAIAMAMN